MSKNAFPSLITSSNISSSMPTFFKYKNPTSISARRSSARNCGFVAGSRASERSSTGMDVKDMVLFF